MATRKQSADKTPASIPVETISKALESQFDWLEEMAWDAAKRQAKTNPEFTLKLLREMGNALMEYPTLENVERFQNPALAVFAFLSNGLGREALRNNDCEKAIVHLSQASNGVSVWNSSITIDSSLSRVGVTPDIRKKVLSDLTKKASAERHKDDHADAEFIKTWYMGNREKYSSYPKAAEAALGLKLVNLGYDAILRHIKSTKASPSARKS